MSKLQQSLQPLSEGDRLRDLLTQCEIALAQLSPARVQQMLTCLDAAAALLESLLQNGADVRAEQARFDALVGQLSRRKAEVVRLVGGAQAFAELRSQRARNPRSPWWQLNAQLREERRRNWRIAFVALMAMAALGGLAWLFRETLFLRDPVAEAILRAERALEEGEWTRARAAIEEGLAASPDAPALLIWRGALSADQAAAQESFERARQALGEEMFCMERAQAWLALRRGQAVVRDADCVLQHNPANAAALMLRAAGYEQLRNFADAIRDLQRASEMAEAQGDATLSAMARVRLALLLQAEPFVGAPSP
ncbi:MAG: hypothetical protein ACK4WM_08690 [Thermoflexales bacterium]